jgi:hypothetical protein
MSGERRRFTGGPNLADDASSAPCQTTESRLRSPLCIGSRTPRRVQDRRGAHTLAASAFLRHLGDTTRPGAQRRGASLGSSTRLLEPRGVLQETIRGQELSGHRGHILPLDHDLSDKIRYRRGGEPGAHCIE